MFLGNFRQISGPIIREAVLLFPIIIVRRHDLLDALLEPGFEREVELVTRLDYHLVLVRVLHFDFRLDFISFFINWRRLLGLRTIFTISLLLVLWEQFFIINLEGRLTQTRPLPGLPLRKVS